MSSVKATHRPATLGDAERLFELRRKSIIALAPKGMSVAQAEAWATTLTVAGMERKIRELEIWMVELDGTVVGWGAIRGDQLEGLYTDPEFAGRGIGTELLGMLEGLMRARGIAAVWAQASRNAEEFYVQRGYEPSGPRTPEGTRPFTKRLEQDNFNRLHGPMLRLAFLASNNGSSMRAIVQAIAAQRLRAEARLVVSNRSGSAAVAFAREKEIPVRIIPTLPDAKEADRVLCEALVGAEVDVVILSGYLRKLGACTLKAFAGRILNTHPALLPKFGGKGMYGRRAHEAVLAAGEPVTGATIHLADDEYDRGRIVAQRTVPIRDGSDIDSVERLVMAAEQSLLVETLVKIQAGELEL